MVGRNAERLLVHAFGVIPVLLRFIQFTGKNIKGDIPRIVLNGLLVEGESLVSGALLYLHFAEFFNGVGVVLVEIDGFVQGGFGAGQIFLAVEERGTEQVVEIGDVRGFGDLSVGRCNRLIELLL